MWVLVGEQQKFFLVCRREYAVGRLTCLDVVVEEQSVSRNHAVLSVEEGGLFLEDKSKFGSKVNEVRCRAKTKLEHKDVVTFGVARKFEVVEVEVAVCLAPWDAALSLRVAKEGLTAVSEVRKCTHLVLSRAAVVPKMLTALVLQKHVVAAAWLEAVLARKMASDAFPNEALYAPGLPEGSALPNAARLALFRGASFCFPSDRVWNQFAALVNEGGAANVFPPGQMPKQDSNRTLFVMPGQEDLDGSVIANLAQLQSRNLPFVTAESIAIAVLKCEFEFPALTKEGEDEEKEEEPKRRKVDAGDQNVEQKKEFEMPKVKLVKEMSKKIKGEGRNVKRFKKQHLVGGRGNVFTRDKMLVTSSQVQVKDEK